MDEFSCIKLSRDDSCAVLTLNRPSRKNALGRRIIDELVRALDLINHAPDVRVLIVTGQGGDFCSGMDVIDMAELDEQEGLRLIRAEAKVFEMLHDLSQVTISAVEGYCLGGGMELALSCDILVSSDKALFGEPEVNFSVLPGIVRVWRHAGLNRARYMALTGGIFPAKEVAQWGIISKMAPAGKTLPESQKIAADIIKKPPEAVKSVKRLFTEVMEMTFHDASHVEKETFLHLFQDPDRRSLMSAFKGRRGRRKA
ncbi:MAG: enoyl-CoA hydratase/isomerase family protein [Deltaproteobacteria bacterium]|nr:enoyl-CoA hydratase/isomerase family protein [Candidatus Zymogenaceae bacterium]